MATQPRMSSKRILSRAALFKEFASNDKRDVIPAAAEIQARSLAAHVLDEFVASPALAPPPSGCTADVRIPDMARLSAPRATAGLSTGKAHDTKPVPWLPAPELNDPG